jgi:hypothetical protein
MLEGLLPIGTVVLLKNSAKRVMLIGYCQQDLQTGAKTVWDYAGCLYPEGYLGPDKTYLFNGSQIDKVYSLGYQDEEQFAFKVKADKTLADIRNKKG